MLYDVKHVHLIVSFVLFNTHNEILVRASNYCVVLWI